MSETFDDIDGARAGRAAGDDVVAPDASTPDVLDLRASERDAADRHRAGPAADERIHDLAPGERAELDRMLAARDRAAAALDRHEAALDRQREAEYLERVYRDELTGALQRPAGRDQLTREVERAHRTRTTLVIAFLDVDHLKRINDRHGHADGDALLGAVGAALRAALRAYDLIVRYGGDEFVCALPGATLATATQRLTAVSNLLSQARPGDSFTVGFAELRVGESLDDVLARADTALYQARDGDTPRAKARTLSLRQPATSPLRARGANRTR